MQNPEWIGSVTRQLRWERKWTVQHLGGVSGIHPQTIMRIENGSRHGNTQTIAAVLYALDHELEIVAIDGKTEPRPLGPRPAT